MLLCRDRVLGREPLRALAFGGGAGRTRPGPGPGPRAADPPRPGTAAGRSRTARSPGRTTAPSVKCTDASNPDTRGRTSTWCTASRRPVNSFHSVTSRARALAAVTGGAGGGAPWAAGDAQAAKVTEAAATSGEQGDRCETGCGRHGPHRRAPIRAGTIRLRTEAKIGREGRGSLGLSGRPGIVLWYEGHICPPAQSTRGPARRDNWHMFDNPAGPAVSSPLVDVLARAAGGRDRLGAPRRLHGTHPERRGAARARSGRARDRHRRLLPRLHQDAGRGMREPRLRRVAARRRTGAAPSRGWRSWTAHFHTPRRRRLGRHGAAARGDGRTPRELHRGLAAHGRVPARRPAAARDRARVQRSPTASATLQVAPLALPTHTLGWIALASNDASACETTWRRAVLEATAKQATLTLHQHRLAEQSRREARRQAALEERNRLARDIHDTLTQGFAAILMQLQAAQRSYAGAAAEGGRRDRDRGGSRALAHGGSPPLGRRVASGRRRRGIAAGCAAAHRRHHAAHHRDSDSADRQRAATGARDGARHRRHRPGGADQRRPPLARSGDCRQRVGRAVDRPAAVGVRRRARHRRANSARAGSG